MCVGVVIHVCVCGVGGNTCVCVCGVGGNTCVWVLRGW